MVDFRQNITEALRHMTGPSGGISYHLAARAYRNELWSPFLKETESWLNSWGPTERKLLVFGPSAGWTLPAGFLAKFESVTAVEPDPVARCLLRYRFKSVRAWEWVKRPDTLPWLSRHAGHFERFLQGFEDHAILFSNLLGQIPLVLPRSLEAAEQESLRSEFEAALSGRNWASYHDLLSADATPKTLTPFSLQPAPQLDALAMQVFREGSHVLDHDTLWLSTMRSTECAWWQLRPGRFHLIGFIRSKKD